MKMNEPNGILSLYLVHVRPTSLTWLFFFTGILNTGSKWTTVLFGYNFFYLFYCDFFFFIYFLCGGSLCWSEIFGRYSNDSKEKECKLCMTTSRGYSTLLHSLGNPEYRVQRETQACQ